ncbi:MAG: hypothetical protein NWE89_17765 [Candidatus Bathyarchaeota archaeon]|nr:hypothetical protein [Candidatus Bathyarchaeota archaeon]
MRTKKLAIMGILCILAITQLAHIDVASANILDVSSDDIYVKAGQENSITINLKNSGDFGLFEVEAFLTSSIPGLSVLSNANKVIMEISERETTSYKPVIYVDQNVELGSYSLSLTVVYRRYGLFQDSTITVPIGIVVSDVFVPKITLNTVQEYVNLKSGIQNQVTFQFKNNGDIDLKELDFSISSSSTYITIVDGTSYSVESLPVNSVIDIDPTLLTIEGTPIGVYTLSAVISYQDVDDTRYHQSFVLPVYVDSASPAKSTMITINRIGIIQDHVQPGDIFDIEIEIQCSGADAYELLSTINVGSTGTLASLTPTTASLGDIEVGETTSITYTLLASGDVSAGQYPVSVVLTYTNSKGQTTSLAETLTIMVEGLIEFELLDTPTVIVKRGESGELEADLLLIGTESVQFVSIDLLEDDVFQRVSGSTEYIGAVDPDSPIPFDINYKVVDDASEGDHDMGLQITYRDHLNKEHTEDLSLDVSVGGTADTDIPEPQSTGLWAWIRRLFGLGP